MKLHLPILILISILIPRPAGAVIAVKLPVSAMYDGSQSVIVGSITKINPQTGAITTAAAALKGEAPAQPPRFKLEGFPQVLAGLKEGSPFVLLTGAHAENFALHLGDMWLLPEATKLNGLYQVKQEKDLKQSYPGTTAALVQIVRDRAAGKYAMLDAFTEKDVAAMFHGGRKDLGAFDADHFTSLHTIKALRGSRKSLVAVGPGGMKFFAATETGITSARASLPAMATADVIAISVIDPAGTGAPVIATLKKNGELTLYETPANPAAAKTVALWKDGPAANAAAFGNFGEDDKPCAIVIRKDQIYRYPLDAAAHPADFLRLTGERLSTYHKDAPDWLAAATAAPLDVNGDGRTDLLINAAAGPMLLINRGHGAFFIDQDLAKILKSDAGAPLLAGKSLWTPIDINNDALDDLLIISDNSAAAVLNSRPK